MNFSSFLPRQIADTSPNVPESTAHQLRANKSSWVELLLALLFLPVALVFAADTALAQFVPTDRPGAYVSEVRDPAGSSLRPGPPEVPAPRPSRAAWALRKDPAAAPADSVAPARKSPGRALAYSLGGTVLLAPLFGTGLIAGPAAGHFYAGNTRQAWTGIAIRGGAYLTAGVGWGLVWGSTQPTGFKDDPDGGYSPDPPLGDWAQPAGIALTVAGVAALLGSATYDIATAWGAAREHNRRRGVQVRAVPAVGPRGEHVGLSVRLRF